MIVGTTAVIIMRRGSAVAEAQQAACLDYCERHKYAIDSVCTRPADAAALVEAGTVGVIVAAYSTAEDAEMDRRARAAGGRVEYVRPPRGGRRAVDVDQLAVAMHQRGATIEEIAHLLDQPIPDVRAAVGRA